MEDDMSSQKPHPHLTTKGLLLVSCWLGDNCWVWKKQWHLWGPWDVNINFKNPWQKSAVMKQTQKMRWEKKDTQSNQLFCYLPKVMTIKHKPVFSLFLLLLLWTLLSSLSISVHDLAGCNRGPAQLCNFIRVYFTGIFLSIFSPEHFPSHYSAFPLQQNAVFNLPL